MPYLFGFDTRKIVRKSVIPKYSTLKTELSLIQGVLKRDEESAERIQLGMELQASSEKLCVLENISDALGRLLHGSEAPRYRRMALNNGY